jgi:hypothetical protein
MFNFSCLTLLPQKLPSRREDTTPGRGRRNEGDLRGSNLRKSKQQESLSRRNSSLSLEKATQNRKRQRPSISSQDNIPHKKPPKPLWGLDRSTPERDESRQRWEDYLKNAPRKKKVTTKIDDCSGTKMRSSTQTAFHRTTKEEVVVEAEVEDRRVKRLPQENKRTDITTFSPQVRCKSPPTSEVVCVLSPRRASVEVVKQKVGQVRVRHVSSGYMSNMLAEIVIKYYAH